MNFKLKPLSAVAIATATILSGCSSDDGETTKTAVFDQASQTGLWCKNPDIVQVVDQDFYPLTQAEKNALRAVAEAADGAFSDQQIADWNDANSFAAYDYKYADTVDFYAVFASVSENGYTNSLGLTNEEAGRYDIAKEEARQFKIGQRQEDVFGEEAFAVWFEDWFPTVPLTDYLGASQRLAKARRGLELSLSSANDSEEVCYTPPASCPNFQIVDESGIFTCITPSVNPLAEEQPNGGETETMVPAGSARIYYKENGHVDGEDNAELYKDLIIHAWNDPACEAYTEDATTGWSQGPSATGIDPIYGAYWDRELMDGHDDCGNIIVYDKVLGDQGKKISTSDLKMPLGNTEGTAFYNEDKTSYLQAGVSALNYDGNLYSNQHPLIGAAAGAKACGWGTELNESGDACLGQEITNCPEGTVAVGADQVDIASKCVEIFDPLMATLYVRGGYHSSSWDADENNLMTYNNGRFLLNYSYGEHGEGASLNEDGTVSHGFKVADENWTDKTNFGAITGGDMPSVDGAAVALTVGEGVAQNITVAFAENKIYQFVFDATKPEATTLKVNDVPVNAFPMMTIGDQTIALDYAGSGIYSATKVNLEASTYTISIADTDAGFAVGAGDDVDLEYGTAKDLVDGGAAMSLEVASAGEFDFALDLSDVAAPKFTANPAVPFGTEKLFIRGTMTSWGDPAPAEDQLQYDESTRTYAVYYGLEAVSGSDSHQFKFASQEWGGALDFGAEAVDFSDDEGALALSGDGNIAVQPSESTSYKFSVSFADSTTGVVKVEEAPIYIRGGIYGDGSWATDEDMRLNFEPSDAGNATEAGHVYSSVVTTTGAGFFKIADEGWGNDFFGFNYGISQAQIDASVTGITLGEPLQLVRNNDPLVDEEDRVESKDIGFNFPAGTYRFSFNDVTKELTVTAVE